jgi:hypothetical protein
MAIAVLSTPFVSGDERPSSLASLAKRLVNGLVSSRVAAAERELRRHEGFIHETALIQGRFRRIGLSRSDVLPFTE